MTSKILFSKESFSFIKKNNNNYVLSFNIKNKNFNLVNIINFNLVQILFNLNKDIFECFSFKEENEQEANCFILMKHLFEDIGLSQYYCNLNIKKQTNNNSIFFVFETNYDNINLNNFQNINCDYNYVEKLFLEKIICEFKILSNNQIDIFIDIYILDEMKYPNIIENLIGLFVFKIFERIKIFIENVKI